MVQETIQEIVVDYSVVTEFSGHQSNKGVTIKSAAEDIFNRVKEQAMQMAVKGQFMNFNTIAELESILTNAVQNKYTIRIHDQNIGG